MSAKLSRKGNIVYVTFESGKRYRLESVLARRRADLAAAEVREREQAKNLWWRLATRSRDVPNSRASRVDLSDNGSGAAAIRENANRMDFYRYRLKLAAEYIEGHTRYTAEEMGDFLRAVFRNRKPHRRDTIREMDITRQWYGKLLKTLTDLFELRDWSVFLANANEVETVL